MANTIELSEEFLNFLMQSKERLMKFLSILNEFRKIQFEGKVPVDNTGSGPDEFRYGGTVDIEVPELTHEEIDQYYEKYAEAQKKEEAIEWLKGFITGVLVGAGA